LLAKLTWWVASGKDSMCLRALRSKYKVHDDWLGKEPIKLTSPLWKAIEKLKVTVCKGAYFIAGDGSAIEGNSLPPARFGRILLQPTIWQVNRPSTCTFSHMTFLMSHVTFSNNTCG
jgi:hypothetical protein